MQHHVIRVTVANVVRSLANAAELLTAPCDTGVFVSVCMPMIDNRCTRVEGMLIYMGIASTPLIHLDDVSDYALTTYIKIAKEAKLILLLNVNFPADCLDYKVRNFVKEDNGRVLVICGRDPVSIHDDGKCIRPVEHHYYS